MSGGAVPRDRGTHGAGRIRAAIRSPRTVAGAALVAWSTWTAIVVLLIVAPVSLGVPWLILSVIGYGPGFVLLSWAGALGAALGARFGPSPLWRAVGGALGAVVFAVGAAAAAAPLGLAAPWTSGRDGLAVILWYAAIAGVVLLVVTGARVLSRRARPDARASVAGAFVATAIAAGMLQLIVAMRELADPWGTDQSTTDGGGPPSSAAVLQAGALLVLVVSMLAAFALAFAPAGRGMVTAVAAVIVVGAIGGGTVVWAALAPDPVRGAGLAGDSVVSPDPAPPPPADPADPYVVADLDVVRAQFSELAELAVREVGPDAVWRGATPLAVAEEACDGGIRFRIEGEFALGIITDTTSDEHDREVIDRNVAAADRIVAAWHEAGLGAPERLHDEPLQGGGSIVEVESAGVDFEFGVAQPFVTSRCLTTG